MQPMKGSDRSPENGQKNGGIGPDMNPDCGLGAFNVQVSYGPTQIEVAVPSNSTFGHLKSVIAEKIGLQPETHKILFRGKEKEDDDDLQMAGVKDNSKVLLVEDTARKPEIPEEVHVISRGSEAVSEVRKEVDKLSEQVSAVQAALDSGTNIADKHVVCLTEMLMRQLLKLDGIEAEGEGRVQRKMEVRRVQSLVETMDNLKSRNSNAFSSVNNTVSASTQWETFEPGCGTVDAASPLPSAPTPMPYHAPTSMQSSAPILTQSSTANAMPSLFQTHVPSSAPPPTPSSVPTYEQPSMPMNTPSSVYTHVSSSPPAHAPSLYPVHAPSPFPTHAPSPFPTHAPSPFPTHAPSPFPTHAPYSFPAHTPYSFPAHAPSSFPTHMPSFPTHVPSPMAPPMPSSVSSHVPISASPPIPSLPTYVPSSATHPMPSSAKVTDEWEQFD